MDLFLFWGKTNEEGQHPALCHMIDIGVMAREIVKELPDQMKINLAREFGVLPEQIANVLGYFAALHDIGKISPGFQEKVEPLCNGLKMKGFQFPQVAESYHGQVCMDTLPDILIDVFGCNDEFACGISCILAAHHGIFPKEEGFSAGDGLWQGARVEIAKKLFELFNVKTIEDIQLLSNPVFLIIAGLVSVADWLGSQEKTFLFQNGPVDNLVNYMDDRQKIAEKIVRDLKMSSPKFEAQSFKEMFGFDKPNSCQGAAIALVSQLTHPMLVTVESSMGSGKTEAALASYAYIAEKGGTRGLYYALPTQATGNAMLPRIEKFLSHLKVENGVELHLLHSNADLNPDYEELRISTFDGRAMDVAASSWFTARKRGLLAGFGVGTIDQALMGVLKVRHFFIRLFGLSGKVLILDEVHAYDAYMQQEIFSLLGWIGKCGTSIILLSATLTNSLREKLFKAFNPDATLPDEVSYPCVIGMDMASPEAIWHSVSEKKSIPIKIRTVVTSRKDLDRRIIELLKDKLSEGGSAACLMNTVADAQRLFRRVKKEFPDDTRILFHSRFKKARRLVIENEILKKWGNKNTNERPYRGIVVATQVIEQSVDVDFDYMISDLAPADLLLQRAGRLHRHLQPAGRPKKLISRTMVVMVPDYCKEVPDFGDTGLVYKKDVLMRTALWLSFSGKEVAMEVSLPGNGVDWIESAYNDEMNVPSHIRDAMTEWDADHRGERQSQVFIAKLDCLESVHERPDDVTYLLDLNNDFDEDKMLSTRLGFKSITLVIEHDPVKPKSKEEIRSFISDSIDVSLKKVFEHFSVVESPDAWKEVAQLRYAKSAMLENGHIVGYPELTYDDEMGLELHDSRGGVADE